MDIRNPLRNRLLLVGLCSVSVIAAVTLVVAEIATWRIEPEEHHRVRMNAFRRLEHVRDRVLHAAGPPHDLTAAALRETIQQLQPFLRQIAAESDVYAYVMVVSPSGTIFAHSAGTSAPTTLRADVFEKLNLANRREPREVELDSWFCPGRIIDFAMPVTLDHRTLASVHLGVSQPSLARYIGEQQAFVRHWFRLTVVVSVAVLCVAAAVAWRLVLGARQADVAAQRRDHLARVGELADGLVHEIRNPLNAMRMQLAVIKNQFKKPNPPDLELAKTQLERLEGEVLRLQDLATDFLAFGKPRSGRAQRLNVAELLSDVADFLRPDLEQGGIRLELTIDSEARRAIVTMDGAQFRQVLLNTAANSKQAMPDGGTLSIRLTKLSPREVRITIRDTGCGIPPEKLERVFDAFFSTKDEGNGLGLSIVKQIITSAGGSLGITSEVGRGTALEINLPVTQLEPTGDLHSQPADKAIEVNA